MAAILNFPLTITQGGDSEIVARRLNYLTQVAVEGWQSVIPATVGGVGEFPYTFPPGAWQIEGKKVADLDASRVKHPAIITVGPVIWIFGQSNGKWYWVDIGDPLPATGPIALISKWRSFKRLSWSREDPGGGWHHVGKRIEAAGGIFEGTGEQKIDQTFNDVGGNGLQKLGDLIAAALESAFGIPIPPGFVGCGRGGSNLQTWRRGGENYNRLSRAITPTAGNVGAPGWNTPDIVVFIGMEENAHTATGYDTIKAEALAMMDEIREDVGYQVPFLYSMLGELNGVQTDLDTRDIRKWILEMWDDHAGDLIFPAYNPLGRILSDGAQHYGYDNNQKYLAQWLTQNICYYAWAGMDGATSPAIGPRIVSREIVAGTRTIKLGVDFVGGGDGLEGNVADVTLDTPDALAEQISGFKWYRNGELWTPLATKGVYLDAEGFIAADLPAGMSDASSADDFVVLHLDGNCQGCSVRPVMDNTRYRGANRGVIVQPTRNEVTAARGGGEAVEVVVS